VALLSLLAYVGMARIMVDANAAHDRVFQPRLPWQVAQMALGDGWAAVVLAPVVALGALAFVHMRSARVAVATFLVTFVLVWAVGRSSGLGPRFFIFLLPAIGVLTAAAVRRIPRLAFLGAASAVIAAVSIVGTYRDDPTSYREAANIIRSINAAGGHSCVVDAGVPPMTAYVDERRDFTAITEPSQLGACDVVVVAAWWQSNARWYQQDNVIVADAERRFANRLILESADPALVLSKLPLSAWSIAA
jgi:hypothetical protein